MTNDARHIIGGSLSIGLVLAVGVLGPIARAEAQCPALVLSAADPDLGDFLGFSVDLDDDRAIMGAPDDDDAGLDAGAAYVFARQGLSWLQEAKLVPPALAGAGAGEAVAIAGNVAVVAAPDHADGAGAAWIFGFDDGDGWTLLQMLRPDDLEVGDGFGAGVALSGGRVAVGAPRRAGDGAVYVFALDADSGVWVQETRLDGTGFERLGSSVDIDGDRLIAGAENADDAANGAGAAVVYQYDDDSGSWVQWQRLLPEPGAVFDRFGDSVAMDGDRAIVGASGDDTLGANAGAAYVFDHSGAGWSLAARLLAPGGGIFDSFGVDVALDGDRAVVGTFSGERALVFREIGGTWWPLNELTRPGNISALGRAVAVSGEVILAGDVLQGGLLSGGGRLYDAFAIAPDCETGAGGCVVDCNSNGEPDPCDVTSGSSSDCNGNAVPDECEPDCNGNGTPDDCDLAGGTSPDCNDNAVPDECEPDCNDNGTADDCDIEDGASVDCDGNGVPDECEPDCNENGITDACDIDSGVSDDCDGNGRLDECDLADGLVDDCNDNLVPDTCELSDYQLDDGTAETALGLFSTGGDLIWLNRFTVTPGKETIRFISVSWPFTIDDGLPATLLLYADPDDDGDPDDAELLVTVETLTAEAGTDEFRVVSIPDTVVGRAGEVFFVGGVMTQPPDQGPAGADWSSPFRDAGFVATAGAGEADIVDLTNNPTPIAGVGESGFELNFLVRADADPPGNVPEECVVPGDANGDGVTDVDDLLLVLLSWGACVEPPVLCAGDLNGDGAVDVDDLTAVLLGWSG